MSLDPETIMAHWPALIGTARRVLPRADRAVWEDIAGDAVERAIRNHERYEDSGNGPYKWLTVIAANLAVDYLRRKANGPSLPLEDFRQGTSDAGSDRHIAVLTAREALSAATEQDRVLLAGYYQDGLSLCEIETGPYATRSTLSRRHRAALRRVRRILEAAS